jgi:hypothetical protein
MKEHEHPDPFDFERWVELASSDTEAFERAREAAVEGLIAQCKPGMQQRLRGLQWRIDQVRRQAGSPVGACMKLSQMMWESVLGPDGLVEHVERLSSPAQPTSLRPTAAVLPFRGTPAQREGASAADTHPHDGGKGPVDPV